NNGAGCVRISLGAAATVPHVRHQSWVGDVVRNGVVLRIEVCETFDRGAEEDFAESTRRATAGGVRSAVGGAALVIHHVNQQRGPVIDLIRARIGGVLYHSGRIKAM